ncbi:MAG TPA: cytochrome P450 [Pyrinomonadaceae bacterium]|nr:cytochrome P450 [Pyrinomonadaceae bacterium]
MSTEAPDAFAGRAARAAAVPPGPRGNRFFGAMVARSRRDPHHFMTAVARDYGDVCSFRVGFEHVYFINHPDYVRDVLTGHYDHFLKGGGGGRAKRFLGEGVLLSEGETHRQRRRLDQPAFHRQRLAAYAAEMVACGERCSARWRDGQVLDIWPEMLRLTLGVVGKTLFGADIESEADEVGRAMRAAVSRYRAFKLPLARFLESLPLTRMVRFRRGKDRLRRVVLGLIEERRRTGRDHGDLLSMLLLASDDEEGGRRLTDEQLWDEALTIFIAGYDTMATALMWTFYLLSQHPEAEARLHEEIERVLEGGRAAEFDDLRRLRYTEQVLSESMRLYPPAWRLVRRAVADFRAGEYVIPRGSLVVICQYAMHRHPRYYPDPERFDPERFTPEARASRPAYAYFPFGGGPRRCLGEGFALTEGVMLLATLARRWRLRLAPGHPVQVFPEHLLRSKHGMVMKLEAR